MEDKKSRFKISLDELESRMELKKKLQDEPVIQAREMLEAALDQVLKKLGVDVTAVDSDGDSTIPQQCDLMGIYLNDITDEQMPSAMGIYITITVNVGGGKTDLIPYAHIGNARLQGKRCFVDITYWREGRMVEIGGKQIIQ